MNPFKNKADKLMTELHKVPRGLGLLWHWLSESNARATDFCANALSRLARRWWLVAAIAALIGGSSLYAVTGGRGVSLQGTFLQSGSGATLRTIESKERDIVSVKDFGAVGDGVANDTAAIQAALNGITQGRTLWIPKGIYLVNSGLTIPLEMNILCEGRYATTLAAGVGVTLFTASSSAVKHLSIKGCQLQGASGGTRALAFTTGAPTDSRIEIADNLVRLFTGNAFDFGSSIFYLSFHNNLFALNATAIYLKDNSDAYIVDNAFEYPQSAPHIINEGANVHITGNTFIFGSPTGTGTSPDILVKPRTATFAQYTGIDWIDNNKFGNEGEIAGRYKIQVSGDASTIFGPTRVLANNFHCSPTQTAIRLDSQIAGWNFDENLFNNCKTLIDDVFASVAGDYGPASIFGPGNHTLDPSGSASPMILFTNGGRGFAAAYPPIVTSDTYPFTWLPRDNESQTGLRNRLQFSEDMSNAAWVKAGVSITTGQTDPWGGTRANLLTRANAATFENVSQAFQLGSIGKQVVVKFWAKSGTTSLLQSEIRDYTAGVVIPTKIMFTLSSAWKQYKYNAMGLPVGDGFSLYFRPAGESQSAGTVTVCCTQVSDQDTDYVPTSASDVTSSAGNRWERPVIGFSPTTGTTGAIVTLTGQVANLAATNVYAAAPAGEYRVCATARTTTSGTGTTANLNIVWTDEGGVKTDAVGTWALNSVTVTGQINKCEYIHAAAASNIQVSVTAGTYGTSVYAISATAERLN